MNKISTAILAASLVLSCCFALPAGAQTGTEEQQKGPEVTWQATGPIEGGYVTCLALTKTGDILAGTTSGLFKSSDNGGHWERLVKQLEHKYIWSIAVTPKGHILAKESQALYRSTDGGTNWSTVKIPTQYDKYPIESLIATSKGTIFVNAAERRLLRSTDDGFTWKDVTTGLPPKYIHKVVGGLDGTVFVATPDGVFRSSDNGDHWMRAGKIDDTFFLAVDTNGRILAKRIGELYISNDNGESWTRVGPSLSGFDERLIVVKGGTLISGSSQGLSKLTAGNEKWDRIDAVSVAVSDMLTGRDGSIFAATGGCGVLKSTDGGEHWTKANTGLTAASVYGITIGNNGQIFAAGPGVWRSTDNGKTWQDLSGGPSLSMVMSVAINSNGHIFAGTLGGRIFRSTDGKSWTELQLGQECRQIDAVAVSPKGSIFVVGNGIFRSTDNGDNWYSLSGNKQSDFADMKSIAFGANGRIFAGNERGSIFFSNDNGDHWQKIDDAALKACKYRIFGLAADTSSVVYAACQGQGVFKSTDNGVTWTKLNLDAPYIYRIALDKSGNLYVGDGGGVVLSTDGGSHGTRIRNGLPISDFMSVTTDQSGYAYCGALGYGVYRTTTPVAKQ